jgi:hypothetical protein
MVCCPIFPSALSTLASSVGALMMPEPLMPAQTLAERIERSKPGFWMRLDCAKMNVGVDTNATRDAKENRGRIGFLSITRMVKVKSA